MVFPITPLDVKVELDLNGWVDVTPYVYTRDPIAIRRGRADEASSSEPSSCLLTFNNRNGDFSPRNPTGPYFGVLGRNTPVRVSARLGGRRLVGSPPSSTESGGATAPDSVALSIVGDLDVRFDARVPSWGSPNFVSKYGSPGQRSWRLGAHSSATLYLEWSADGTTLLSADSTMPVPRGTGRQAVRATIDVDNGAAGRTITFYTASTAAGPWVQLGDPVVQAGVTSIFDSTATTNITLPPGAEVYSTEVRNGIAGALVANPIFSSQAEGAASFADAQGNTWTIAAGATLTDRRYRFHGEVSAWPSRWDISGKDIWVPVVASGITRRFGQGSAPLRGSLNRFVVRSPALAYAYWPMEDTEGSTSIASGLPAGAPMTITGTPRLAADSTMLSSLPLPEMGLATLSGPVTAYAATGTIFAHFLVSVPLAGDASGVLLRIFTDGTAARWDLSYVAGGSGGLAFTAYDSLGTLILTSGVGQPMNGTPASMRFQMVQAGGDINWEYGPASYVAGAGGFGGASSGTLVGRTVGAAQYVQVNPSATLDTTVIGHVAIYSGVPDTTAELKAARGWVGETAGDRASRLCSEEGVAFSGRGAMGRSVAMGIQRSATLLTLLSECEVADLGAALEPRDFFGLGYRTRESLYNQDASLAIAYGNLSNLDPVEDDQGTRNDVTVSRRDGSSARQELTTGPLSTQAPPNGVGRYDDAIEISVATDAALPDQANWRLRLGTIDEARYPTIVVALETPAFAASSSLMTSALDLDIGDLITVSNPPAWLPPDQIRQIAQGFTEVLAPFAWSIQINCTPASSWGVGVYDQGAPATRYAADGATLSAGITSTATALSIVTPTGKPLWTSAPADFPLDIVMGGERITLSAIAATASPQAATVSARSVNGVVKAHLAGAALEVADVAYYAL